jgi:hypothetical protein
MDESALKKYDRIFFFWKKSNLKTQEKIIETADKLNIKISSIPDLAFYDYKNFFISKIATVPYISINKLPLDNVFNIYIKRYFDIVFFIFGYNFNSYMVNSNCWHNYKIIIQRSCIFYSKKEKATEEKYLNVLSLEQWFLIPCLTLKWQMITI